MQPDNVMFYDAQRTKVKLVDFGGAKDLQLKLSTSLVVGTLDYCGKSFVHFINHQFHDI
jgi:hypothetical protein